MTVSVKSLQKQLIAAVAMVLVAMIALGSSTYAWFVSSSTVNATTAQISATSNAAFLQISLDNAFTTPGLTTVSLTPETPATALYPATVKKQADNSYKVQTGFAARKDSHELSGDLKDVTDLSKYTLKGTVYIKAQEGSFTNLKGDNISVTLGSNGTSGKNEIANAMRVLLVCGTNWQVLNSSGGVLAGANDFLKDTISTTETATVDIYVFYDGDDTQIFTDNLPDLGSAKVTVAFSATQDDVA